jgi:hypothetical protein
MRGVVKLGVGAIASGLTLLAANACGDSDPLGGAIPNDGGPDGSADSGGTGGAGGKGSGGAGGSGGSSGKAGSGGSSGTAGDSGGGCKSSADCADGESCDVPNGVCIARCANSLDCVGSAGRPICDPVSGTCVECNSAADCGENHDCVNHACVEYTPCVNSLDCPSGQVCDSAAGRCVECTADTDCGDNQRCAGNLCRPACQSDNQCTPLGLLCDKNAGYCVQCVAHGDCAPSENCRQGACVGDVCTAGNSTCEANAVVTCDANGAGYEPAQACSSGQTCTTQGGAAVCETWICTPSQVSCDVGVERVVECSADGLTENVTDDCAAKSQVCVAAACKPVVCNAGQLFCSGTEVRRCSAKGDTSTLSQTCTAAQYCDTPTATCMTRVCTPNAAACNGNLATTCNAIGSGYQPGGTDCTISGEVCSQGACVDQICTPNTNFCENNVVRRCSADGLTSSVWQTCTAAQYCDVPTATCKTRVCTPDAPACNGNVATTCNAIGSGYQPGGTDCSPQFCSAGQCVTALFTDDFEDGDFLGWTALGGTYTRSVTTATAADGTARSFLQTKSGVSNGHNDGVYRTFSALQPTTVSWWARQSSTTRAGTYFLLYSTTTTSSYVVWHYFNDQGQIYLSQTPDVLTPYSANTWYHFELRNINWTARTYDYYINGVLTKAGATLLGTGNSISRLDLYHYHYSPSTTGYWDEIEFR